jgi:anti-sigma regulatory factor (Ser/Thr protein kinase)
VVEVELRRETTAPRAARALLRNWFAGKLSDDELYTATLLASELVTNAVRHGRGKITLRALLDDARLLVDVTDEGSVAEPVPRRRGMEDPSGGGRGLMIVAAESSRWGIEKGTAHVWFELERSGPRLIGTGAPTIGGLLI